MPGMYEFVSHTLIRRRNPQPFAKLGQAHFRVETFQ